MKKVAAALPIVEAIFWILASLYARRLVDIAAARWQFGELGGFFARIMVVLALIAFALWLHRVIVRWLVRKGLLPPERQD
jgi:hypothetical protein